MPQNASTAFGQLRYIAETVPGETPVTGNGVNLRNTGPTMKAAVQSIKSNEIQPNRMTRSSTNVDLSVDDGFNFELSQGEYDPFIAGVLGGVWQHYGVDGLGDVFDATTTTTTITAGSPPAGSSAFTTLKPGQWFKLLPPASASAVVKEYFDDKWFKVDETVAPTAGTITLSPLTPLAGAGLISAAMAGARLTSSELVNGNARSSFTFEWEQTDIGQFLQYRGMRPNTMSLDLKVGSIITGSFGFFGQSHDITQATTLPGTPIASQDGDVMNAVTDMGMIAVGGVNLLAGGTSFVSGMTFNVNNNLRGQKALGVFGNVGVGYGELAISGTVECYFQSHELYKQALDGINTSIAFGMADGNGGGYLIENEKVRWGSAAINYGGKDSDVMVSLPFDAFYSDALGRGIRVTRAVSA